MYTNSLPGVPEAAETVRPWAFTTARQHHPELADEFARVVALLVSNAVPRTPEKGLIAVTITPTADGLRVEVHDPGHPLRDGECGDRSEWSEVSTLAASFGSERTRKGHFAWAELWQPSLVSGDAR